MDSFWLNLGPIKQTAKLLQIIHLKYSIGLDSNPRSIRFESPSLTFWPWFYWFLMVQSRPLFDYFRFFSNTFCRKILDFSGIRTWVVVVEAEHADHHGHGLDFIVIVRRKNVFLHLTIVVLPTTIVFTQPSWSICINNRSSSNALSWERPSAQANSLNGGSSKQTQGTHSSRS